MRTNRTILGLESLEARNAPSSLNFASVSAMISHDHDHDDHHLLGNGNGSFVADRVNPDAGKTFHVIGEAHLDDRGSFVVNGTLHSVGFINDGRAGGRLTFTDDRGSFTIQLVGPEQKGFSALPQTFHYYVVGGTGAFEHLKAHGELDITRDADHGHDSGSLHFHFERH